MYFNNVVFPLRDVPIHAMDTPPFVGRLNSKVRKSKVIVPIKDNEFWAT